MKKTIGTLLLCFVLLVASLIPVSVWATESRDNRVKVGYFELKDFQEGAEEETVKTGCAYEYYSKISEYTGLQYEYVYGSYEELYSKFLKGDIDLMMISESDAVTKNEENEIYTADENKYYLSASPARADLATQLNNAQKQLAKEEPNCKTDLYSKHYLQTIYSQELSKEEKEWIENHSTLKTGYLENYLPYCATDSSGNVTGIIKDVMKKIMEELNLQNTIKVEYRPYESNEEMIEALNSEEIDLIFPIGGGLYYSEENGIHQSASVVSSPMDLVYKGSYPENKNMRIAVNENNLMQLYYIKTVFPDAEIKMQSSIDNCLEMVNRGYADGTVVNGLRSGSILKNDEYRKLNYQQISKNDDRCFGVSIGNKGLLKLINRGVVLMGDSYVINLTYKYTEGLFKYTLGDFIRDNMVGIIAIVLLVAILIIMQFVKNSRERERYLGKLLEARNQAESANIAKTTFLFNMSHDIRTPMNAIIGFVELLEKNQDNPEKRADYLHKIKESSNVLLSILNNVLEMARIEKGTLEIEEEAWSVEQFNDTLYSVFHQMMEEKNIEFTREVNVEHHYVFCDLIKLREVFLNILSNAHKYTDYGGKVTMKLTELPGTREGYAIYRTEITDNGIGMSPEFIPHIFEEFSREKSTTYTKIEGTGLGLSIVKRLVDIMGGTIAVTSEKGVGTTFTVEVEHRIAEKSDLTEHGNVSREAVVFAGKRILLAEDNELNAEIAVELLSEYGFVIEVAEDGQICVDMLEKAEAGYYDLIIMDIQMPNLNGYQATRKIRAMKDEQKANIPIVAMTANTFEEDKRESYRAGMNGHLGKPIDMNQVEITLRSILS